MPGRTHPVKFRVTVVVVTLSASLALVASCRTGSHDPSRPELSSVPPSSEPAAQHRLHNVIEVTPELISGSVPEGDAAFAELDGLGVRTVVSVDGATPDLASARRYGMRYVHLPVGYHGIEQSRQLELVRVLRDLPGPVYMHCHHGKHRGPAAAASAAVGLGLLSPEEGVDFMRKAGTSDSYPGLYRCVQEFGPPEPAVLESVSGDFPEVAPVPGFVRAMSGIQAAYDHLVEVRDAGWTVPATHPDLVPLAEAEQLSRLLGGIQEDPERDKYPADFREMLHDSWRAAQEFEAAMRRPAPPAERSLLLRRVNESCLACHRAYRNEK